MALSIGVSVGGVALALLLGATLVAATARNADAQERSSGKPEIGLLISHKWCSRCHIVSGKPRKLDSESLPAFIQIAINKRMTRSYLLALLSSPKGHLSLRRGIMPAVPLSRDQIVHVIAYIESLRSSFK